MFSGIVEAKGIIREIIPEGTNTHFVVEAPFTGELKIDQSISHNGACLTVVEIGDGHYKVTAIDETLRRTNMGALKVGDAVNLERCMKIGDRLDGHIVQGHVDLVAECVYVEDIDGSWKFGFRYSGDNSQVTVPKGSICVNGVSLTVVDSDAGEFSVCIIPYTFEHTTFGVMKVGNTVNLEFDVIGKYVMRYLSINNK